MARPRTSSIDRFNVASDLRDNRKFIRFRMSIGTDERTAYLVLVRFFNYVAINCAFDPKIETEDADLLASFCWFDGDPEQLINALTISGFIEQNGSIHEWFSNQPLADIIYKDRERKDPNTGRFSQTDDSFPRKIRENSGKPVPKIIEDKIREDKIKRSLKTASSSDQTAASGEAEVVGDLESQFLTDWNQLANELPAIKAASWTPQRRRHFAARCGQTGFQDAVRDKSLLAAIRGQPFVQGQNKTGWAISFSRLLDNPELWVKIHERTYENGRTTGSSQPSNGELTPAQRQLLDPKQWGNSATVKRK